ncbi:MAG: tetratricopeptide repeat protein [Gammaproteobacteria bacterium]|nr:tetratricopeptide repeat protein [Gammaproteobacteria bacterium]
MVYFKVILFFSLVFSHMQSYANETDSACLTLISDNQCIEALEVCTVDAEQGDPQAQTALGMMLSGITHGDFRKNYKQSFYWVKQAAEQGYGKAELAIAEMYMNGVVIPMNAKKAKVWYEKAAAKENLDGVNGLARQYRYGTGVRKDYEKAFQYYQQAALEGHTRSQIGVGLSYRDAKGVKKNMVKAYAWILIAAEKIDKQQLQTIEKRYKDERENLDQTIPQCKHLSRLEQMSEIMATGYAQKMLVNLKQRMSIKQINKAKKLALEIKKERVFTRSVL